MLNLEFEIPDQDICGFQCLSKNRIQAISELVNQEFQFQDWSIPRDIHMFYYTFEMLKSEHNIDESKYQNAHCIQDLLDQSDKRSRTKIENVVKAVSKFLPEMFNPTLKWELEIEKFEPKLAKDIHKCIGANLIPNCGSYRTNDAYPSGSDKWYTRPSFISKLMDQLFTETKFKMKRLYSQEKNQETLCEIVKVVSQFTGKFLEIHPFSNGNGRTVRILLSWLLRGYASVPVSLYGADSKLFRQKYLDACCQFEHNPGLLARIVLDSMYRSLHFLDEIHNYFGAKEYE